MSTKSISRIPGKRQRIEFTKTPFVVKNSIKCIWVINVTISFEKVFKSLRESKKMTQSELAQILGISKSMVSAYETGARQPSHDVLFHISKIYKVSIDCLWRRWRSKETDGNGQRALPFGIPWICLWQIRQHIYIWFRQGKRLLSLPFRLPCYFVSVALVTPRPRF